MLSVLQCSVISSVFKVYVLLVKHFCWRTKTHDIICFFCTHKKWVFQAVLIAALIWGVTFVSFTINMFICTVYFLLNIFLSCYYLNKFCTVLLLSTSGWCSQTTTTLVLCNLGWWMFLFAFCGGGPECFSFHRGVSFSTSAALQDLLSLYIK